MVEERRNKSTSREWSKCCRLSFRISFLNNAYWQSTSIRRLLLCSEIYFKIISISMLDKRGFHIIFNNNICSIYHDDDLYVNGYLQRGIYVLLDVNHNSIMHVSSSFKRKRDNQVNKTYLWHCRLGHIGEKRINKLHKEGYLDNYESYETCESCLKGKMTKSPFIGSGERASELLGLIHTDVYGPVKIQAKFMSLRR